MITIKNQQGEFLFRVAGILRNGNKILFQKNKKGDAWVLPGGRAEVNEPTEKAVVREFLEELGFNIKVIRLFAVIENFNAYGYKSLHEFGMYYEVSLLKQLPHDFIQFEGIEESVRLIFRWVSVDELHQVNVYHKALKPLLTDLPTDFKHLVNLDD
ncbi:NUDIX hydrolase [Bacillus sp. FJAT-28004]|uniref:NUDIX hydrolase n=1 Tax=Bacillus sp. FJAT-28004 TaxID=1679165 RepID=UPI0006B45931|nr:NUDIX domain-containing protein [Bacillus sp. FJAT-28004]